MAFVRDWDRRIDVEMPITGSLDDPHFNVWDAIWDIFANIIVKPPTILSCDEAIAKNREGKI
jgi:hypothetical protein